MSGAHSDFGGSIIGRIIACPGSYALSKRMPPGRSSAAADEGSFAHKLAEMCLKNGDFDAQEYLGTVLKLNHIESTKLADQPIIDAVNIYLRTVKAEVDKSEDAEIFVEDTFAIDVDSALAGEVFGSNDCIVYSASLSKLTVFDYKHGAGVTVDVDDSPQLKFYALGALLSLDHIRAAKVELVIVQPRSRDAGDHESFGVKRYALNTADALDFHSVIDAAIRRAKQVQTYWHTRPPETWTSDRVDGVPVLSAGDHCKFCPANAGCPARFALGLTDFKASFQDVMVIPESDDSAPYFQKEPLKSELPSAFMGLLFDVNSAADLGKLQAATEKLKAWCGDVQKFVMQRALDGVPVEGFKLVAKQERRKFIGDETECANYFAMMYGLEQDKIQPRKLLGVTAMKSAIAAALPGKESKEAQDDFTLRYTEKKSSGVTLVPRTDKRPAASAEAIAGFSALDFSSDTEESDENDI